MLRRRGVISRGRQHLGECVRTAYGRRVDQRATSGKEEEEAKVSLMRGNVDLLSSVETHLMRFGDGLGDEDAKFSR